MSSEPDRDRRVAAFSIDVSEREIADLGARLRSTRYPLPLPDGSRRTGVPQERLVSMIEAWASHDWRAAQQRLNALHHIETTIDGQRIHAVHARSPHLDATPLIITHGWPGSFLEHLGLIGPLTEPEAHGGRVEDAFHVVIPSLPGFAFSTPLEDGTDVSTAGIARTWLELMSRLGYDRFLAQGGDIGAGVAPELGRLAPERVLGVHVNGTPGAFVGSEQAAGLGDLSELEHDRVQRVDRFMQEEIAYIALQSTRPALLGTLVADSPAAQLAWILDKLDAWTWPIDAPAEDVLGLDFVLENASLYWFTRSAGTAAFVGYARPQDWGAPAQPSGVPTAAIQFAHDIGIRRAAEREHDIVRWTDITDRGGHFAALEEPETLVSDVREFARSLH